MLSHVSSLVVPRKSALADLRTNYADLG